jgi:hypothetical protein
VNTAPKFGDLLRGVFASKDNPQRDGRFVRAIRRRGRINPGLWYLLTDGKGRFWEYRADATVFVEKGNDEEAE